MTDFYASLTGGNVTRDDLQDEGVIKKDPKPVNQYPRLTLVEDSPGPGSDPRINDIKKEVDRVEEELRTQAREAMKDPSKDIDSLNSGVPEQAQQAKKTALEWLSEGYNFWIVVAIVFIIIWRK